MSKVQGQQQAPQEIWLKDGSRHHAVLHIKWDGEVSDEHRRYKVVSYGIYDKSDKLHDETFEKLYICHDGREKMFQQLGLYTLGEPEKFDLHVTAQNFFRGAITVSRRMSSHILE